ncbi:LysR substrate-binding domain-containing protein [Methylocella tundrae]|uniref:Transcriptional regulator, LysR family n=1 Tax=Methylocella tundrae TaxID=227605 RepID=A0A4U8Z234_METTU|nr:LysR substrate-binding domain-containing protein [Methylocella tundrae]WPP03354.1 LysR substrate-binding domain-containing protein [Methylocella tundrae]VFU09399.1 Transcriptional regulator, LysR family [Methylocella tundrae]
MTLEQLRIFVAVAERQHMTQAARDLNLAQSAASSAIAALEARHDAKLFNRVGRRIELTEAGRIFLDEARSVLAQAESAERALREINGLRRGALTVQASQTIASYWLPRHLVAFHGAYPLMEIKLTIGNTAQVAAAVEQGAVEIGFVEGAIENEHLAAAPVARDQLALVVGPEHPWAERSGLDASELIRGDWVLREKGSGTRSVFEAALMQLGVDARALRVVMEMPSNEAVRAVVEAGLGATALSASVAAPSLEAGLLRQAPLDLPDRAFYALSHRERSQSRAAKALLAIIGQSAPPAETVKGSPGNKR